MKWSLYIGKIAGIKIFIHWTFIILILFIIMAHIRRGYGANEILLTLAFVGAVFACVTLHELGHALTARRYHFKTTDINLLPIGGIARMEGLPEKPFQELMVAIMGPAVNFAIALILFLILSISPISAMPADDTEAMYLTGKNFWISLYAVNFFIGVFNLIPAFPMDGGRILRALLSFKISRRKATLIAARIGQFIAIVFVFLGFLGNPILIFIGFFVFLGAQAEAEIEETKFSLAGLKVSDALMRRYSVLKPQEPLSNAISLLLDSQEKCFIVKDDEQIKGVLSQKEIISGVSQFGKNVPVENVMQTQVPYLQTDELLQDILQRYTQSEHTLLPVFEGNHFTGVLNIENIVEYMLIQNAAKKNAEAK